MPAVRVSFFAIFAGIHWEVDTNTSNYKLVMGSSEPESTEH